jgi:hypothetical protein
MKFFILFHIFQENDKNKRQHFFFTAKYFLILLGRAGRTLTGRDMFNFERWLSIIHIVFRCVIDS